jgi:hypothetical protein
MADSIGDDFVPLFPYNGERDWQRPLVVLTCAGTTMTGGDSLHEDLNIFYNAGDIAWMITATALVLLMIPGVGYVYLVEDQNSPNSVQLLLLRPCSTQIGLVIDMALHLRYRPHFLPMVLLGLLSRLLTHCWKVHWRLAKHRPSECASSTLSRL